MPLGDILGEALTSPFNAFDEHLPERMAVFGAGGRGRRCRERLERLGIRVPFFLDNDPAKQGGAVDGVPVLAPAELAARADGLPVLVSSWGEGSIVAQLFHLGLHAVFVDEAADRVNPALAEVHADELREVLDSLADEDSRRAFRDVLRLRFCGRRMRFSSAYPLYRHPLVRARRGDCIVDGGAADGDTLLAFLDDCQGDCALHLFEPTQPSFGELQALIAARGAAGAVAVNKALWSCDTTLRFVEEFACTHSNRMAEGGGCEVAATSLDAYAEASGLARVDLIKLDVEGAELEALRGAAGVIRRDRPRLQVCLYHKVEDLWEIPLYIKSIAPEYRMFVGHHSCCALDTVLYCVV